MVMITKLSNKLYVICLFSNNSTEQLVTVDL